MRTIEQHLDTKELRRLRTEDRQLDRLERQEKAAAPLIGELCREGKTVYYINVRSADGKMTGKIRESTSYYDLVDYLIRNNYI